MSVPGSTEMVKVDFVADVVCPWCYLGWRALSLAIERAPDVLTEITWRPFLLDPSIPETGVDRRAYMSAKFPDQSRLDDAQANIKAMGAELGIEMDLGRIAVSPNTLAAHRVIRWAGAAGLQEEVLNALMAAYFREGRDIGDPGVLADIAEEAGMDRAAVLNRLSGPDDIVALTNEYQTAAEAGVTGVPFAIFNGQMAVSGAQSPERYLLALSKAASKARASGD